MPSAWITESVGATRDGLAPIAKRKFHATTNAISDGVTRRTFAIATMDMKANFVISK